MSKLLVNSEVHKIEWLKSLSVPSIFTKYQFWVQWYTVCLWCPAGIKCDILRCVWSTERTQVAFACILMDITQHINERNLKLWNKEKHDEFYSFVKSFWIQYFGILSGEATVSFSMYIN